jgi:hypothetical protein
MLLNTPGGPILTGQNGSLGGIQPGVNISAASRNWNAGPDLTKSTDFAGVTTSDTDHAVLNILNRS